MNEEKEEYYEDYWVLLGLIYQHDPKIPSELRDIFHRAGFMLVRSPKPEKETRKTS